MSPDPQAVEDLYTKIALDNKLVTRFQVRKAAEEVDTLAKDGQKQALGDVMVRLGFLSERQHQSVVNACRYREQRDYDKNEAMFLACYASDDYKEGVRAFAEKRKPVFKGR